MLHDYFRACWRGILKHKLATCINVGGLALGLSVFFALTYYVRWEFSWDAHWQDADRIYRITGRQESPTSTGQAFLTYAPYVMGTSLQSRHPDAFETLVRVHALQATFGVDTKEIPGQLNYAEPALLDLVQLETLEGSLHEVFADPASMAISDRVVNNALGGVSPLGKTLTVKSQQGERDFVVKAIYRVPEPSVLMSMQFITPLDVALPPVPNARMDLWNAPLPSPGARTPSAAPPQQPFSVMHYAKLRQGIASGVVEADLRAFMDENRYMMLGENKTRFLFQNLQDAYLSPGPFDTGDNVQRLWLYAAIGVLVLLISGCNFVMLATLRLVDRMREVGIRKSIGAETGQLVRQYLLDAFCLTFAAAAVAALLLKLVIPRLQPMLQLSRQFDPLNWPNVGMGLLIITGFTLLSSAWPAWLMARGKPARLFRNGSSGMVASGNGLRRLLVGIQFAIVIVLLLASTVVQQQIRYTQSRDRGFSLDDIVAVRLGSFELIQKIPTLVTELANLPGVRAAAAGGVQPNAIMISQPPQFRRETADGKILEASIQTLGSGGEYFSTLSVPILAGREFSTEIDGAAFTQQEGENAPLRNVLLNVSAAQDMGFATPDAAIGQLLQMESVDPDGSKRVQDQRIVGVVADTQFSSIMMPPVPQVYFFSPNTPFIVVKRDANADVAALNSAMDSTWHAVMGDVPYAPLAPELLSGNMMRREEFEAKVIIGSTALAIVIALLGLYGLVAATVVKRVKEIGVRKVMGADRKSIVTLLLWQFSKPVVVANLFAWPLGYWAITQWLQRFPYQLDTPLILLSGLAASLAALLIAWLTVGFMATKAASAKPVLALRAE